MDIRWERIKKDYPRGYELLKVVYVGAMDEIFCERSGGLCYYELEAFFDDNEIIININPKIWMSQNIEYFPYILDNKENREIQVINSNNFWNQSFLEKDEAKEKAIYKSFEILENKLNEVGK
jgi:hypothetical protein